MGGQTVEAFRMMKAAVLALIALLGSAALTCSAALPAGDPVAAGLSAAEQAQIGQLLQAQVDGGAIAGVVAGVARNGELVYLQGYGWQDREAGRTMQPDSIFRIDALSMPLAAVAALQLVEQGRLGLEDPVSQYIPRFAYLFVLIDPDEPFLSAERKPSRAVTIEDLLNNTAGLEASDYALYQQRRVYSRGENLGQLVNRLASVPLLGDPGTRWRQGMSVTVLGHIVELVTGQALDDYLRENVLAPLRMDDTAFFVPADKLERLAAVYAPADSGLQRQADLQVPLSQDPPLLEGAAGLVSSAPDYLAFLQALLNQGELYGARILQPETVADMTRNQLPEILLPLRLGDRELPATQGWGYGIGVTTSGAAPAQFGWQGRLGTYAWADPASGVVAVLMLQSTEPASEDLAQQFKTLVLDSFAD